MYIYPKDRANRKTPTVTAIKYNTKSKYFGLNVQKNGLRQCLNEQLSISTYIYIYLTYKINKT